MRTARGNRASRCAMDICFAEPRPVSLITATGGDQSHIRSPMQHRFLLLLSYSVRKRTL
jgi:hypothetical protein